MTAPAQEASSSLAEAVDGAIRQLQAFACQRLTPGDIRSLLADLCGELRCHFFDLPGALPDLALSETNASKAVLYDALLEARSSVSH